jgi:hypothetical protein
MIPDESLLASVKGFLDPEEGQRLYDIALAAARRGPCLEVGSYCGKSALFLGAACREAGGLLYSVDHHGGSEEQQPGEGYFDPSLYDHRRGRIDTLPLFRDTLERAGLQDWVVPMVCRSTVAARGWATPLSLVFIDGGHAFETVLADYNAWSGHVAAGGFLLFHDIFEDPSQGGQAPYRVYRLAEASGLFRVLPATGCLAVLQRRMPDDIAGMTA